MTTLKVRDLMTTKPFTLSAEATLVDLYDLMDTKHIRHVPVVNDDGNLLGLASHRDLLRTANADADEMPISTFRHMMRTAKVDEVMTRSPETIDADEDIRTAGTLMAENKFGCLPVVEGDTLVGILTESDFVRYVVDEMAD